MPETNDAVRLVQRVMAERGLDMKRLSQLPGAPSYNALRFFLLGRRETRPQTYRKLEAVLGIEAGELARLAGRVGRTADLGVAVFTSGADVVHLPEGALSDLSDTERAEVLHHLMAEAYARASEVRGRRRRQGD